MVWAKYGAGKAGQINHAVQFHVSFHLWEENRGHLCGDRYFAEDDNVFRLLQEKGCWFVLRSHDEAVEAIKEKNPVSDRFHSHFFLCLFPKKIPLPSSLRTKTAEQK